MAKRNTIWRKLVKSAFTCFGVIGTIIGLIQIKDGFEVLSYTRNAELRSYIASLSEGKSVGGKTLLPQNLKRLSQDGSCYVTFANDGLVMVFFPTDKGWLDKYGYFYCSRSLDPADYVEGCVSDLGQLL